MNQQPHSRRHATTAAANQPGTLCLFPGALQKCYRNSLRQNWTAAASFGHLVAKQGSYCGALLEDGLRRSSMGRTPSTTKIANNVKNTRRSTMGVITQCVA